MIFVVLFDIPKQSHNRYLAGYIAITSLCPANPSFENLEQGCSEAGKADLGMARLPEMEGIWDLHGCSHGDVVQGINSNQETIKHVIRDQRGSIH